MMQYLGLALNKSAKEKGEHRCNKIGQELINVEAERWIRGDSL